MRRGFGRERELQRWQPSAEDAALEDMEDGDMPRGGGGGPSSAWDQFEANHKQFGVQVCRLLPGCVERKPAAPNGHCRCGWPSSGPTVMSITSWQHTVPRADGLRLAGRQ